MENDEIFEKWLKEVDLENYVVSYPINCTTWSDWSWGVSFGTADSYGYHWGAWQDLFDPSEYHDFLIGERRIRLCRTLLESDSSLQRREWYYNEFSSNRELWDTLRNCGIKEEES